LRALLAASRSLAARSDRPSSAARSAMRSAIPAVLLQEGIDIAVILNSLRALRD
jgi:hypothetical protein